MFTKQHLQNLLGCVEIAQRSGQIPVDAMANAGISYTVAKRVFEQMGDDDILFATPPAGKEKKTDIPAEASPKAAE